MASGGGRGDPCTRTRVWQGISGGGHRRQYMRRKTGVKREKNIVLSATQDDLSACVVSQAPTVRTGTLREEVLFSEESTQPRGLCMRRRAHPLIFARLGVAGAVTAKVLFSISGAQLDVAGSFFPDEFRGCRPRIGHPCDSSTCVRVGSWSPPPPRALAIWHASISPTGPETSRFCIPLMVDSVTLRTVKIVSALLLVEFIACATSAGCIAYFRPNRASHQARFP